MASAYLNAVASAVPEHDIHGKFIEYGPSLLNDERSRRLFRRMAERAHIDHRYSFLKPHSDPHKLDAQEFYDHDAFPGTEERMRFYERHAFSLAQRALDQLDLAGTTHLITTTCTGFYAPGIDQQIIQHYELSPGVERTQLGFMGCYAALNGLKLARHIVRSEPEARVLLLNLELCTLHLQRNPSLEELLSFLVFADGCSASLITAKPQGLELQQFGSTLLSDTDGQITWHVGDQGFDMHLSGQVSASIAGALPIQIDTILAGYTQSDIAHWAIHPGGRSVLDAVGDALQLGGSDLDVSRSVLRRFGNMSSATIMFVLQEVMRQAQAGDSGCAMAFGPGVGVESLLFHKAS